jgi:hypothetical protein
MTHTGAVAVADHTGFRNRIINGDMRIDQRNAGASQTLVNGTFPYTVDRWFAHSVGSNATGQRVAGSGSTQFNYQITGAANNTSIAFLQRIEATNCYDLAGQNVTLSCNLANSLLTSVNYSISYAATTDNFSTTTVVESGSWTVNSTLARYTKQIFIPAAATNGLQISLYVNGQISGTFTIGNVQLEAGSSATSFERRPIGTELALCQRYFEKSYALATVAGTDTVVGLCQSLNGQDGNQVAGIRFLVPKRATPTGNFWSKNGTASSLSTTNYGNAPNAGSFSTMADASEFGFRSIVGSGGLSAGTAFAWHYTASAEL